jgi:hypothetical protein
VSNQVSLAPKLHFLQPKFASFVSDMDKFVKQANEHVIVT